MPEPELFVTFQDEALTFHHDRDARTLAIVIGNLPNEVLDRLDMAAARPWHVESILGGSVRADVAFPRLKFAVNRALTAETAADVFPVTPPPPATPAPVAPPVTAPDPAAK